MGLTNNKMKKIPHIEINPYWAKRHGSIKVALPPINFFLKKLKNKEHFQFLRMNHGFFDRSALGAKKYLGSGLKTFNTPKEQAHAMYDFRGLWYAKVRKFLHDRAVMDFLEDVEKRHIKELYMAVSDSFGFGWNPTVNIPGIPGGMGSHSSGGDGETTYVQLKSCLKLNHPRPYLHGGLFRHYMVKDELDGLFDIIKDPAYNFIIVGPRYCLEYKDFLGDSYTHVLIKYRSALDNIEKIKKKCKSLLKKDKHNVILASLEVGCFPLARSFRENDEVITTTVIDLGRAFDYRMSNPPKHPWLKPKCRPIWERLVDELRETTHLIEENMI